MPETTTDRIIDKISSEAARRIPDMIEDRLKKIILFGSYARGDQTEGSDIDIAVLVDCDRAEVRKYKHDLVRLSAEMDLENMVVVNFICLPFSEFNARKSYYPFYSNIEKEGKVIYG